MHQIRVNQRAGAGLEGNLDVVEEDDRSLACMSLVLFTLEFAYLFVFALDDAWVQLLFCNFLLQLFDDIRIQFCIGLCACGTFDTVFGADIFNDSGIWSEGWDVSASTPGKITPPSVNSRVVP